MVSPCVGQSSRGWQLRQRGEVSTFAILSHASVPSGAGCAVARLAARVTNPDRSPTTPARILPSPATLRTSIAVSVIGPSFCADLHGRRTGFARAPPSSAPDNPRHAGLRAHAHDLPAQRCSAAPDRLDLVDIQFHLFQYVFRHASGLGAPPRTSRSSARRIGSSILRSKDKRAGADPTCPSQLSPKDRGCCVRGLALPE